MPWPLATIQAQMLSGRYRSESVCEHWSKNRDGFVRSPHHVPKWRKFFPTSCQPALTWLLPGTNLSNTLLITAKNVPHILDLITSLCIPSSPVYLQFLLDCSVIPEVIAAKQNYGDDILAHLFTITATWIDTRRGQNWLSRCPHLPRC